MTRHAQPGQDQPVRTGATGRRGERPLPWWSVVLAVVIGTVGFCVVTWAVALPTRGQLHEDRAMFRHWFTPAAAWLPVSASLAVGGLVANSLSRRWQTLETHLLLWAAAGVTGPVLLALLAVEPDRSVDPAALSMLWPGAATAALGRWLAGLVARR